MILRAQIFTLLRQPIVQSSRSSQQGTVESRSARSQHDVGSFEPFRHELIVELSEPPLDCRLSSCNRAIRTSSTVSTAKSTKWARRRMGVGGRRRRRQRCQERDGTSSSENDRRQEETRGRRRRLWAQRFKRRRGTGSCTTGSSSSRIRKDSYPRN